MSNAAYNGKQKFLDENLGKNDKQKMISYIKGNDILEVGCGSGVNLNLIEEYLPAANIQGIDISEKVIETLKFKKEIEGRNWNVIHGNGLNLNQYIKNESIDTLIFCSVIHELFSYVEWQGKKFNYDTIDAVLENAYRALKIGGRLIIRDGIMSNPKTDLRRIVFKDESSFNFLKQYCKDFKGREIKFKDLSTSKKFIVEMNINDCMEFLYTFTWGYESYSYEVQEQYGYYTIDEYKQKIENLFGDRVRVLECSSYLQDGYKSNLKKHVKLLDNENNPVELPDSNCLVVIEKLK